VVQAPTGSTVQKVDADNDGLREVETAPDGNAIDGNNDGIPDAQQATVAGFRLINDGASSADFGALEVQAGVQLQFKADPLVTPTADGSFSFAGKDGAAVTAALPQGLSNSFAGVIAFEVANLAPGGSTDVTIGLPRTIALSDPNQSAYIRFNYASGRFEEFVDDAGNPLYNLVDRNGDGVLDGIQLKLVDGDLQWDGDGIANGTVVDPGTLVSGQRDFSGGSKRDRLTGNVLANTLRGYKGRDKLVGDLGKDTLIGGADNDRLDGGEDADLLIGGGGRDRFIYRSEADSAIGQSDTIRKFSRRDRFDLRNFDTDVKFEFIGNDAFSGKAGELRATRSSLQADLTGDGIADFRVNFTNNFRLEADQLLL
jgi:Ca2+-binding RTX toxin-like protein